MSHPKERTKRAKYAPRLPIIEGGLTVPDTVLPWEIDLLRPVFVDTPTREVSHAR